MVMDAIYQDQAEFRVRRAALVRRKYGPEATVAGECLCGHRMAEEEFNCHGGTLAHYDCEFCHRVWVVDLRGVMRPLIGTSFLP